MNNFYTRNKIYVDKLFLNVGFVLLVYVCVVHLFKYVAPFVLAFLLAMLLDPLVKFLNSKLKIGRGLGALFCLLFTIVTIFILGSNLVAKIWVEASQFAQFFPSYIADLTVQIERLNVMLSDFMLFVPETIRLSMQSVFDNLITTITKFVGTGVQSKSINFVSAIPNFFVNTIVFLLSTFFFMKDKEFIGGILRKNSPPALINYYVLIKTGLFEALGGYIKAQAIIMSIIATISIIALVIVDYPYALLMGLLIAFVDALPIFGGGFILWPWIALSLISGDYPRVFALLILYGINFVVRQFLEPKVLSTQIGIYPVLTLLSIYVGLKVFGFSGVFLGPIIVVSLKILNTNKNAVTKDPSLRSG